MIRPPQTTTMTTTSQSTQPTTNVLQPMRSLSNLPISSGSNIPAAKSAGGTAATAPTKLQLMKPIVNPNPTIVTDKRSRLVQPMTSIPIPSSSSSSTRLPQPAVVRPSAASTSTSTPSRLSQPSPNQNMKLPYNGNTMKSISSSSMVTPISSPAIVALRSSSSIPIAFSPASAIAPSSATRFVTAPSAQPTPSKLATPARLSSTTPAESLLPACFTEDAVSLSHDLPLDDEETPPPSLPAVFDAELEFTPPNTELLRADLASSSDGDIDPIVSTDDSGFGAFTIPDSHHEAARIFEANEAAAAAADAHAHQLSQTTAANTTNSNKRIPTSIAPMQTYVPPTFPFTLDHTPEVIDRRTNAIRIGMATKESLECDIDRYMTQLSAILELTRDERYRMLPFVQRLAHRIETSEGIQLTTQEVEGTNTQP